MSISYDDCRTITTAEFIDLMKRSTLAERRPIEDTAVMGEMIANTNLLCTAWDGEKLVGIARSLTDFAYSCYLADLAIDAGYQHRGIGRELIRRTQARLGPYAKVILLAAPKAVGYYGKIGFDPHPSAWTLPRDRSV